jgi:hypothetical protein
MYGLKLDELLRGNLNKKINTFAFPFLLESSAAVAFSMAGEEPVVWTVRYSVLANYSTGNC